MKLKVDGGSELGDEEHEQTLTTKFRINCRQYPFHLLWSPLDSVPPRQLRCHSLSHCYIVIPIISLSFERTESERLHHTFIQPHWLRNPRDGKNQTSLSLLIGFRRVSETHKVKVVRQLAFDRSLQSAQRFPSDVRHVCRKNERAVAHCLYFVVMPQYVLETDAAAQVPLLPSHVIALLLPSKVQKPVRSLKSANFHISFIHL